jgi:hypothetical protein
MTALDALAGLLLAGVALFGLGLPIAWLLPAPSHSTWVLRIAAAPLYAMALCSGAAAILDRLGMPLHPVMLAIAGTSTWVVAWWRTRERWRLGEAARLAAAPALMVALSGFLWALSLKGFGLYLPNRDFKNHAYFVAQVAWKRSADTSLVLRPSPISSQDVTTFYPLGLHTVLGWVLPTTDYPTVAVTAAAAVLVTSISTPLALIALARFWAPGDSHLGWIAGSVGVLFVGLANGFRIGSVVLLVVAALYAASLAMLWQWVRSPTVPTTLALTLSGVGLLVVHVAEAVGLALVAVACLPAMLKIRTAERPSQRTSVALAVIAAFAVAAAGLMLDQLVPLLGTDLTWDLQSNQEDVVTAVLVSAGQQPGGNGWGRALWVVLALAGFTIAARRRWSAIPVVSFLVPVAIGALCGLRGLPDWLNLLTAPWYGSAARVGVMAMAPVALAGSLALVGVVSAATRPSVRTVAAALALASAAALAVQVVPNRRTDLTAALAGAGDSPRVAQELASLLRPGESVLTFEGDGTANLFAFARVPVTAGFAQDPAMTDPLPPTGEPLEEQLLRLADPAVRSRLTDLGIAYIALGSYRYWGEGPGYLVPRLLEQPELRLALTGTDMVVLKYDAGAQR